MRKQNKLKRKLKKTSIILYYNRNAKNEGKGKGNKNDKNDKEDKKDRRKSAGKK